MTDDADNPEDVQRFDLLGQRMAAMDALRVAIGGFLVDFAHFESLALTGAIKALAYDDTLVEQLPELTHQSRLLSGKRLFSVSLLERHLGQQAFESRSPRGRKHSF